MDTENGGVATVTSALAYDGAAYSAYMYFPGPASGTESNVVRAYPEEVLTTGTGTSNFEINMEIYVPSTVNGTPVDLTDWISFLTVYLNQGYWQYAPPITIDSGANQQISMDLEMGTASAPESTTGNFIYVYQTNPITWSFNTWFELSLVGNCVPGGDSTFTVYQNGVQIMTWSGELPTTGTGTLGTGSVTYNGLTEFHVGLYIGGDQGTYAIYNDDFTVYDMSGTSNVAAPASGTIPTGNAQLALPNGSLPAAVVVTSLLVVGSEFNFGNIGTADGVNLAYKRVRARIDSCLAILKAFLSC